MRNRAFGLFLFVFSLVVTACGGSSARTSRRSASSPTSGHSRTSPSTRLHGSGPRRVPTIVGGTASNIVTKAPADYAANIQTFVDQGYGIIVTVGFAMGDATTVAAKQYPKVKFIGVDQGVCIDETGKGDPTFACKGDPKTLLPNYQGLVFKEEQAGYLAGILAASVSEVGRHRRRRRHQHDPGRRPLHQRLPQRRRVGQHRNRRQGGLRLDRHHQGLQRPGHRQVDRPADDRPEGRRRSSRSPGCPAPARSRRPAPRPASWHRRRRRPVEVAAAVGQVHPHQRREEAGQRRRRPRSEGRRQDRRRRRPSRGTPRPTRSASALSPFGSDYKDLVTPEIQAKIDAALAGMKAGTVDPVQADTLRQEGLTRR